MAAFRTIIWSSVVKKLINAVTGLGLCLFIIIHLAGNITLLTGNAEKFNAYAHFLISTGILVYLAEIGMIGFFVFHIFTGVTVWWDKQKARKEPYKKVAAAGEPSKKTISSRTMIYTGVVMLIFTVLHLKTLKYGPGIAEGYVMMIDGHPIRDLFRLTAEVFSKPGYVIWYVAAMSLLGFHLRHGFWSLFQSLGANHPRYSSFIYGLGLLFALIMAVGFIAMPVVLYLRGGAA
ncbi:MAG: succinate dehydrogenase cytochrome b subunit [FCB group bacterium]|nr:succinate dehydrogenase cytochrome b subunit [FCB group bacterium]